MSDFLSNLAVRSLGPAPARDVLQPRLPSLFEAPAGTEPVAAPAAGGPAQDRAGNAMPGSPAQRGSLPAAEEPERLLPPVQPERTILERFEREASLSTQPAMEQLQPAPQAPDRPVSQPLLPTPGPGLQASASLPPEHASRSLPEDRARPVLPALLELRGKPEAAPVLAPLPVPVALRAPGSLPEPPAQGQPSVHIHIGRIEVRAVTPPPAATPRPASKPPRLTLDDYLHQRNGGKR